MKPHSQMRAVMAHCWTGSPDAGWYPAVGEDLRSRGYRVEIPALPEPDAPTPSAWLESLTNAIGEPDQSLLLIGHSLGALAVLHWLAATPYTTKIAGLLIVAPPLHPTGITEVDRFLLPAPNVVAARFRAVRAAVLVSDVDQYLLPDPQTIARRLGDLGFERLIAPGKGHFSPASGLTELPEVGAWVAELAATPN